LFGASNSAEKAANAACSEFDPAAHSDPYEAYIDFLDSRLDPGSDETWAELFRQAEARMKKECPEKVIARGPDPVETAKVPSAPSSASDLDRYGGIICGRIRSGTSAPGLVSELVEGGWDAESAARVVAGAIVLYCPEFG
jgi:hypothetical protein